MVTITGCTPAGVPETRMPSTHLSLYCHLIFSTKDRQPLILDAWRERLHAYLGGVIRAEGAVPHAVGGTIDHVHVLIGLRATHRLADLVREVKSTSSQWIHETLGVRRFSWQEGYGAFSVSPGDLEQVRKYIEDQADHHRKASFQEEYVEFLLRNGVQYDPRYLW
jgi:REP element-mobilizing transposase RayT